MDMRPALKTGGSLALGVLALGAVQSAYGEVPPRTSGAPSGDPPRE